MSDFPRVWSYRNEPSMDDQIKDHSDQAGLKPNNKAKPISAVSLYALSTIKIAAPTIK